MPHVNLFDKRLLPEALGVDAGRFQC
ncbi:hypothetical protein BCAR13_1560029 [Paraburkholderia caribensis]|nr:hypothetical protein BCAR13_1560029 [Paraburkholderia caribensis]